MPGLGIIPLSRELLPQVAALEQACFSTPWSIGSLEAVLDDPLAVFLAAVEGEAVAGYIGMHYVLDEGFIDNVAVAPGFRKRGAGKKLVAALLAQAAEKGLRTVTLEVRPSNGAAIHLYSAFGFVEVGRRKGYYSHPKEDALLMTREII